MKTCPKFISLILLALLLTACGADVSQEQALLSNSYTAAAATINAQASSIPPTATQTAAGTATLIAFPTTVPATVTSQSVVSYSSASQSTASGCNNAAYVSDVTIADGTVLAPGETFVKTWKFQNTGTCAWEEDYSLTFVSGKDMEGEDTALDQEVASGATASVSVSLTAPSSDGTYIGYWRLADADGNAFGQSVYVMIMVSDEASTLTPTATTESTESTATPTATTAATETVAPTATPTETPTETNTPEGTTSE